MKVAFFDNHNFEQEIIEAENCRSESPHQIKFFETRLTDETCAAARGYEGICIFVNDKVTKAVIRDLQSSGLRFIVLRSAGFNHVDLNACKEFGIKVARVPAYSPHAIAEHAVGMLMTLNRKIHRSYSRVRELNFSLEGLVGFDLFGKTVGIIGTGKIGTVFARIMSGFGCKVIAYDCMVNNELVSDKVLEYCSLKELYNESDIISLHLPLSDQNRHMINSTAFSLMKDGVYLINTSRGALIDTKALLGALKKEKLGGACLDVYEEEEGVFFLDLSGKVLQDDTLARLLTFPNVIITAHQAFLTKEALSEIARITISNLTKFEKNELCENEVVAD